MALKPEVKQKWVEALRSGRYKQGRRKLRVGDEYCCLGVLCDIAGTELDATWIPCPVFTGQDPPSYIFGATALTQLDAEQAHSIGIRQAEQKQLIFMNDTQNSSFSEIADYIETNL